MIHYYRKTKNTKQQRNDVPVNLVKGKNKLREIRNKFHLTKRGV